MSLINCEVNFILTWSKNCVISSLVGETKFKITDTKLYVPVVTLSTQDTVKLLQQLKSDFRRSINWNKYQSDPKKYARNRYLNHLINSSFQGVNRLFVLSFEIEDDRTSRSTYYLPKVEIRRIATGQGDDYTTGCLLDYFYFKENYKMIAVDLSEQQVRDADPRAIQQINFAANLDRIGDTTVFFIIEEAKETVRDFSQGTVKVL